MGMNKNLKFVGVIVGIVEKDKVYIYYKYIMIIIIII